MPTATPTPTTIYNEKTSVNGKPSFYSGPEGMNPNVPKPVTVLSSGGAEQRINDNAQKLKSYTQPTTYKDGSGAVMNADGSYASAPADALYSEAGGFYTKGEDIYRAAPSLTEDQQIDELYAQSKRSNDAAYAAQVESIKANFSRLKAQQEEINRGSEGAREQQLLMGGSSRYTLSGDSIMAKQKSYGLSELADLAAQEETLLAAARSAYQAKDHEMLDKKIAQIEKVRDAKNKKAEEASTKMLEELTKQNEQIKQASRDSAVAGLIGQGISDPRKLIDMLNYDDQGNMIGDFTADEISKTLKNLTVEGKDPKKLPQDIETFNYLRDNGMLPEGITKLDPSQQYFAYLQTQKLANAGKLSKAALAAGGVNTGDGGGNSNVVVGAGAKNATDEQIIRMRLFAKLSTILNKGTLSDTDREVINNNIASLRNAGMSEQEIMSRLAGFPTDVNTPYNQAFIDIAAANTETNEQQQVIMSKVGQLLAAGNATGAMNTLENSAMNNAKKTDPDNYMGTATAQKYLANIQRVRAILDQAHVGPISGSFQDAMKRFKGKEATKLKAELTQLYASFRKENAGSAVTESELRFLDPLFASISDRKGNFQEKLDAFERQLLQRYNSTRSTVSLPEVDSSQVIDAGKRLKLYQSSGASNPFSSSMKGTTYSITDDEGNFEIPDN